MAFEELKEKQRVIWGAGPSEHEAFVEFFDGDRTEDGIRQPRPYLIALGTRR